MQEYPQKVYGAWGGNPKGNPYKPDRCAKALFGNAWDVGRQCSRPSGHGDRGLFCKQHAKRHPAEPEA